MDATERAPRSRGPESVSRSSLRLLRGALGLGVDGRLHLELPAEPADRAKLRDFVARTRDLDPGCFVVPEGLEERAASLSLLYAPEDARAVPVGQAIHAWRRYLPASVSLLLGLAQFLLRVPGWLMEARLGASIVSPVQVRYTPRSERPFRLLVLPPAHPTLADVADADQDAWIWLPPEVLAGRVQAGAAYAAGAALHHGFTGNLFPEALGARERLHRLLSGRIGSPAKLAAAIASALPLSMRDEASGLERLTLSLLEADPAQRPADEEARRLLDEVAGVAQQERLLWHAAASRAGPPDLLVDAIEALERGAAPLDDRSRLFLAHVEARHLDRRDAAVARLERPCQGTWAKAARAMLLARLLCDGAEYARVSRLVKEGCAAVRCMPAGGGTSGRVIHAYLLLLDGVANYGAVAQLQQLDYMSDSFKAFIASLDVARELGHEALIDINVHWLGWIARFAEISPAPLMGVVHTGVRAYLWATGLFERAQAMSARPPPGVPWYGEDLLLPHGVDAVPAGVEA